MGAKMSSRILPDVRLLRVGNSFNSENAVRKELMLVLADTFPKSWTWTYEYVNKMRKTHHITGVLVERADKHSATCVVTTPGRKSIKLQLRWPTDTDLGAGDIVAKLKQKIVLLRNPKKESSFEDEAEDTELSRDEHNASLPMEQASESVEAEVQTEVVSGEVQEAEQSQNPEEPMASIDDGGQKSERFLVSEDEESQAVILAELLERSDARLISQAAACQAIMQTVGMPNRNGMGGIIRGLKHRDYLIRCDNSTYEVTQKAVNLVKKYLGKSSAPSSSPAPAVPAAAADTSLASLSQQLDRLRKEAEEMSDGQYLAKLKLQETSLQQELEQVRQKMRNCEQDLGTKKQRIKLLEEAVTALRALEQL